jgi:hypothetical protein
LSQIDKSTANGFSGFCFGKLFLSFFILAEGVFFSRFNDLLLIQRHVFGERNPPHKEHLLRRSQSLEFSDSSPSSSSSPFPPYPSLPSSPTKSTSSKKSKKLPRRAALAPLSSISVEVLSDDETVYTFDDESPTLCNSNPTFLVTSEINKNETTNNNNNNNNDNPENERNNADFKDNIEINYREERDSGEVETIENDEERVFGLSPIPEEGEEEDVTVDVLPYEDREALEEIEIENEEEGEAMTECNIKEAYRCKGQSEPEEEGEAADEEKEEEDKSIIDREEKSLSELTDQCEKPIDDTDREEEYEERLEDLRKTPTDVGMGVDKNAPNEIEMEEIKGGGSGGMEENKYEIEMEVIKPKTEERPKKLGKKKVSVLQLTTQGDSPFFTRYITP